MELTVEFKKKVAGFLLNTRGNFGGSDSQYAQKWGLNNSIYSRLKDGEVTGIIKDAQWLEMGRKLGLNPSATMLEIVKTEVYDMIKEDIDFCRKYSKSRMFIDDCEIGKSVAARHICLHTKNAFYVDASQSKVPQLFIRAIAKAIGIDNTGKYTDVKAAIKYRLQTLEFPIVVIDDAGDLHAKAFLELKEFWNGTEDFSAWYLIGDDSLLNLIERSIRNKKPGFRALYSRFSNKYSSITPNGRQEKLLFYTTLIKTVLEANIKDHAQIPKLVAKCLTIDNDSSQIGGLRRLASILILNAQN